jgi:hypothetical protein
VAERLAAYDFSKVPGINAVGRAEPELVERAATLLTVMPPNQRRQTIEDLLAPHDHDRGRRAVEALIATGFAAEDEAGRLRRVR